MRVIKFRAWFKVHKKMVYNLGFNEDSFRTIDDVVDIPCVWDKDRPYDNDNATFNFDIMQHTELKDKNGVEIYEGDILYIDNSRICTRDVKGRVVFEYGCFNVVDDKNIYYTFCEMGESIISIIGNIHENPELIK